MITNYLWPGARQPNGGGWPGAIAPLYVPTAPYLSGYFKRMPIRYGDRLPNSDLVDFPKLISLSTNTNLATEHATVAALTIAFTLADGVTVVPFGNYPTSDYSIGKVLSRVKFPTLSASASPGDILGYLYYKGEGVLDLEDKAGAVSNGYIVFMPLEENPGASAPQMVDWTSGAHHGTCNGGMDSGDSVNTRVGNGLNFDRTANQSVDIPHHVDFNNDEITVEATINALAANTPIGIIDRDDGTSRAFQFRRDGTGELRFIAFDTGGNTQAVGTTEIADGLDHYVAGRYDSGGVASVIVDGVVQDTTAGTPPMTDPVFGCRIAIADNLSDEWHGIIDEVRVSNIGRSDAWLQYAYEDDLNNARTFTLGPEETGGASSILRSIIGFLTGGNMSKYGVFTGGRL